MSFTDQGTDNSRGEAEAPVSCAMRDVAPFCISVMQFAVAIGATIAAADVDPIGALAGSALLSAGSAQLAAIELIDDGATVLVAASSAILINARFMLYGAGFARWFADESRWRYLLVFPIVDQSYVLCERRFHDDTSLAWRRRYYLVVVVALFASFLAGQVIGFVAGDLVPTSAGLHLAGPFVFAGLLAVTCRGGAASASALGAAGVLLVGASWLGSASLLVAALAGMTVGAAVGARTTGSRT